MLCAGGEVVGAVSELDALEGTSTSSSGIAPSKSASPMSMAGGSRDTKRALYQLD